MQTITDDVLTRATRDRMMATTPDQPSAPSATSARFGCLLVGIDGTDEADRVLGCVVSLATRSHLAVHLTMVRSPHLSAYADEAEAESRANMLRRVGVDVTVHLLESDEPADALVSLARSLEHPLLCFASHGRAAFGEALFGSVTTVIEQQWPGPVLLVGPEAPLDLEVPARLELCVNEVADVAPLTEFARAWQATFDCDVEVLEAIDPSSVAVEAHRDEPVTTELALAHGALGPTIPVRWVPDRDPVGVLLQAAAEPGTVLAVHSHLRRGFARLAVGSVAGDLVRLGTSPVVVLSRPVDVRPRTEVRL